MKKLILVLSLLLIVHCAAPAAGAAQPTDYVRTHEDIMCQFGERVYQWSLVDSNMGVVTFHFIELPPYTIVDANIGRVEFTPQEAGEFYIRLFAACEPNDPNACLWPEVREEEVQITVNPSQTWELQLVVSSE